MFQTCRLLLSPWAKVYAFGSQTLPQQWKKNTYVDRLLLHHNTLPHPSLSGAPGAAGRSSHCAGLRWWTLVLLGVEQIMTQGTPCIQMTPPKCRVILAHNMSVLDWKMTERSTKEEWLDARLIDAPCIGIYLIDGWRQEVRSSTADSTNREASFINL